MKTYKNGQYIICKYNLIFIDFICYIYEIDEQYKKPLH